MKYRIEDDPMFVHDESEVERVDAPCCDDENSPEEAGEASDEEPPVIGE